MDPVPACAAAAGGAAPPPAPDPAADPSDALSRACRAAGGADVPAAQWDRALRGLCADRGAQDSNLSAIGDPVEFQALWTAAGAEQIRATLDPVPGASGAERRARAVAAVPGLSPGQRALRAAVTAAQQAQGARFGGWIGLRPGNPGLRRKLYLELPGAPETLAALPFAPLTRRLSAVRAFAPVLLGLDPGRGTVEIYAAIAPLARDGLGLLLADLGLPPLAREALQLLTDLRDQSLRPLLPTEDQGLSLSWGEDGTAEALTWYVHCDALLGPAARARESLLAFGQRRGWAMPRYRALSAPVAGGIPWHGLVGLTLGRSGLALSVTCATRCEAWRSCARS
ncbi:hypothetical protein [Rhodobacter capsulatus]|uniref:hypothetical protein n=1 Tax=Rhodobacter capsulatus TaxID=1061 RepID=UPI0003D35522|nr:hypothetical protein [Rhodobacter capsulatus]ETD90615.1 hypothetical protein U713_04900 [Rhodobacter capsulatus YW2]